MNWELTIAYGKTSLLLLFFYRISFFFASVCMCTFLFHLIFFYHGITFECAQPHFVFFSHESITNILSITFTHTIRFSVFHLTYTWAFLLFSNSSTWILLLFEEMLDTFCFRSFLFFFVAIASCFVCVVVHGYLCG